MSQVDDVGTAPQRDRQPQAEPAPEMRDVVEGEVGSAALVDPNADREDNTRSDAASVVDDDASDARRP